MPKIPTEKKSIYKRKWFIVLAVIVVLVILGNVFGSGDEKEKTAKSNEPVASEKVASSKSKASSESKVSTESKASSENKESKASEPAEESVTAHMAKEDNVPAEYKSALRAAERYSDRMHMSKAGIYDQLTSEYGENFPAEAAQYAIDNLQADYNYNALKSAESYNKTLHMSKAALYDQLVSEYGSQFTAEEAHSTLLIILKLTITKML